jgi:hypothetical protein
MAGTALKLVKFFGEAPKISPELLPETVAQYAFNLNLSTGDLLPYRRSEEVATLDKVGTVKTIYPMTDPVSGDLAWLHWTTDVDVAVSQNEGNDTQRIYFSGDGAPKVTNYALATSGAEFPTTSYTLGLPLPAATPVATPVAFTDKTVSSFARDAGNTATIVTTAAHGLTTGDFVTVSDVDDASFNLSNVPVTVINSTTFSYFNFGPAVTTTAESGTPPVGKVVLAGTTIPRNYVFTYYTQWDEESVPSEPSTTVFVKEGQTVNISGLPASWTHGSGYNTTGMKVRIYRTVATVSGTEYFRVGEVNLGTTTFVDDVDVTTLDNLLESEDYDAPNPDMQGILSIHNGMIVGFFGNTLCFCEPGKPHAWPIKYRRQVDAPIVGLGAFGTTLLVLTENTPWKVDGNNPAAITLARTDYILPCVSKRSIVNIGFGVVWASTGGLAVYSTTIGTDYLTKNVHSWESWQQTVVPENLVGKYYRGRYFGSDTAHTFIFERNDQVGGHLVQTDVVFTAAHYRSATDQFYYAHDGKVFLWDSPAIGPAVLDWKSKVFTTKQYINFGAARVIADYTSQENEAALNIENGFVVEANQDIIDAGIDPMGALGTVEANELYVAGSNLEDLREATRTATFQLFVNKQLIFSTTRSTDDPFRLPTGYRADTFEVRVATTARIRAIHLAETMVGLRGV